MEAQSEYVHTAYTFFARSAPACNAQSELSNKISASELSRKSIKGALLVGMKVQTAPPPTDVSPHLPAMTVSFSEDRKVRGVGDDDENRRGGE